MHFIVIDTICSHQLKQGLLYKYIPLYCTQVQYCYSDFSILAFIMLKTTDPNTLPYIASMPELFYYTAKVSNLMFFEQVF